MRRSGTISLRRIFRLGLVALNLVSARGGVEGCIVKQRAGQRYGGIGADYHSGLGRQFDVLALLGDDVNRGADQADDSAAGDVRENQPGERASSGTEAAGDDVALQIPLLFPHYAFGRS